MLSCFAKLVPCRDIMICPKSHSEMKIGIRSSLDHYCSYLRLTGFLSVLPRGQEAFFFIKQKQMCLSKYCEILESSFVFCTGRSGTVSLDQQQHLSMPNFGRVLTEVTWCCCCKNRSIQSLAQTAWHQLTCQEGFLVHFQQRFLFLPKETDGNLDKEGK